MKFQFDNTFSDNLINLENNEKDSGNELIFSINPLKSSAGDFKTFALNYLFDISRSFAQFPELLSKLDRNLKNHDALMGEVREMKTKVTQLEVDATAKDVEIRNLTEKITQQDEKIARQDVAIAELGDKLEDTKVDFQDRLDQCAVGIKANLKASVALERHSRSFNLRLMNVPEKTGEKSPETIETTNAVIKSVTNLDVKVEYGHRTGAPRTDNTHRVIIFRLLSRQVKRLIMEKRKLFFDAGYLIFEDLPKDDLEAKKKYKDVMKRKHSEGDKVAFRQGSWFVNGRIYK
jgi:uncharacterized coiled-coil protein SlyX